MSDNMGGLDTFDVGYAAAKAECAAELSITQQKLEAAEARIRASQEQEPVSIVESVYVCPDINGKCRAEVVSNERLSQGAELFCLPVIPPDVAELQRENAELTRKLAEQRSYSRQAVSDGLAYKTERDKLLAEAKSKAVPEGVTDNLQHILNWCEAYPLSVFPEPDFKRAASVLKENGMTLDAISASNMRHVLTGVKELAQAAMRSAAPQPETDRGSNE